MSYETDINAYIPMAEKEATKKTKTYGKTSINIVGFDGKPAKFDVWSGFFHDAMNRLTREAGLRKL